MSGNNLSPRSCPQTTKNATCRPTQRSGDLLRLDHHEEQTEYNHPYRTKQAPRKTRNHRPQRDLRLQTLKKSILKVHDDGPAATTHGKPNYSREDQQEHTSVIHRLPQAGVAEAFPNFDQKTSQTISHYFNYCKSPAFGRVFYNS